MEYELAISKESTSSSNLDSYSFQHPNAVICHNKDPSIDLRLAFQTIGFKHSQPIYFGGTNRFSMMKNDEVFKYITFHNPIVLTDSSESKILNNNKEHYSKLIRRVQDILPSKRSCDALLNYFFLFIHNIYPIIDEETFRDDLSEIIRARDNDHVILFVTKDSQLRIMAIYLLILKISYRSLPFLRTQKDVEETFKYARNKPLQRLLEENVNVDSEFIILARAFTLIPYDSFVMTGDITYLQFLLLLRICLSFSPFEEVEDSIDTVEYGSLISGIIVSLAVEMGFHRDPDVFSQLWDEKVKFGIRKVWHQILIGDALRSSCLGRPLEINNMNFDIKVPFTPREYADSVQIAMHVRSFSMFGVICKLVRESTLLLLGLRRNPKRSTIELQLKKAKRLLNNEIHHHHRELFYKTNNTIERCEMVVIIQMKFILLFHILTLYHVLIITCETNEYELKAYFYKAAAQEITDSFLFSNMVLENCSEFYGSESLTVICPLIFSYTHRAYVVIISMLLWFEQTPQLSRYEEIQNGYSSNEMNKPRIDKNWDYDTHFPIKFKFLEYIRRYQSNIQMFCHRDMYPNGRNTAETYINIILKLLVRKEGEKNLNVDDVEISLRSPVAANKIIHLFKPNLKEGSQLKQQKKNIQDKENILWQEYQMEAKFWNQFFEYNREIRGIKEMSII